MQQQQKPHESLELEGPALERLEGEVAVAAAGVQRLVVEGGAGLGAAAVEVCVQPEGEAAVAGAHEQPVRLAAQEVLVVSRPSK